MNKTFIDLKLKGSKTAMYLLSRIFSDNNQIAYQTTLNLGFSKKMSNKKEK